MKVSFLSALLVATIVNSLIGASQQPEQAMKIMTCNVRVALASDGVNAWTERKDFLCDMLREARPEILGLQEAVAEQLDAIIDALPHRASIGEARDGGRAGEYSAIVYDTARFDMLESGTFWLSDTPQEPSASWGNHFRRVCTWGRFTDKAGGRRLYVFNTHLDHESENARYKGVELIISCIANRKHAEPVVITGDFNADESSPPLRLLTHPGDGDPGSRLHFVDTFRVLHPEESDVGTFHAFTGHADGRKIDYVLVQPGTRILSAEILRVSRGGRYPSDHYPVSATVVLD